METKSKAKVKMIVAVALLWTGLSLSAKEALAQPKPEGTLRIAIASIAEEGFLPYIGDFEQGRAWPFVYEYPFYLNEKTQEPIPGLAKSFRYSKDGLTLTLVLREGVPWQEGWGEVTAEDVKFTYEKIMQKGSTSTVRALFAITIKNIEAVDRYTVALHLKQSAPEFWVQFLGTSSAVGPILCKKYIEAVGDDKARTRPIGTGPYRLGEHKAGQHMKFEAFDKHWRAVPEFKHVILQIVPEESTRVAMLKTGETDIAPISALTIADLQKTPGIKTELWPGGYILFGWFGGMITPKDPRYKEGYHLTDPWKDKKVRQAMNLAIDSKAIIKSVYKGAAKPISVCWALPGWEKLPSIPYDPAKAKRLLAEAGYPNGFNMTVVATSDWAPAFELPQVMEIVAGYFKAIGINATIKLMDKATQLNTNRGAKDVGFVYPWKETYKDNYAGKHQDRFCPGGSAVFFQTDELTSLINRYEAELDPKERATLLGKIRDYHYNEWTTIPIVVAPPVWAHRTQVVGDWPLSRVDKMANFEYIRHPKPLNTWRLFTP